MSNTSPIRILLVDDHAMVRRGLAAFLSVYDDLELVGEAGSGLEALEICRTRPVDVVLMDLMLPGMDGAEATRLIRQAHPQIEVIVITSFKDEQLVQAALQAGALSYLLKNVAADELAGAIRAARAGRPTLAPEATAALIHAATQPPKTDYALSPREREVLGLLIEGASNPQIAATLTVSLSTVKFHVSSILTKLGVASRTEAVALALQQDLVG